MSNSRRRWSVPEKRAATELTMETGASVSDVAMALNIAPSQLSAWLRQMADGELDDPEGATFARVDVLPCPSAEATPPGKVVIVFPNGVRMRIEGMVVADMLSSVLGAVR